MMLKRLKQLVIGGATLAALALGSSATAGAAAGTSGSPSASTTLQEAVTADPGAKANAAPLASVGVGWVGAVNHVRDRWIHDLYLTDHELYIRHHERLASEL
jgi:hypothetical protein